MMRASSRLLPLVSFCASLCTLSWACAVEPELSEASHDVGATRARLAFTHGSSTISQTSTQAWRLAKVGSVSGSTVTWQLDATRAPTASNQLVVDGAFTANNTGDAPATIGNIVVELQHRPINKWITLSSNVADATDGDDATSVKIVNGWSTQTVTENAASGTLAFRRENNGAGIALVPQISMAPGAQIAFGLTATFDNGVLGLPVGRKVRAVITVTYGNAGNGPSATDVDINGNGAIDPDEARVKSEAERLGHKTVPAPTSGTTAVELTDTIDDLSTTGTVTFSNPVFNLGALSGTVTVTADGGADGGTITNCGHLMGPGVNLEACDTQDIAPSAFEWSNGDMLTYGQATWGGFPNPGSPANVLVTNYSAVYAATSGVLEIGVPGPAGYSIVFTSGAAVNTYIPASGPSAALTLDFLNPTTTMAGSFGGYVTALQVNVDYGDAGLLPGALNVPFGDVTMCGYAAQPLLNGRSVRQFLGDVRAALGGGAVSYGIAELAPIANSLSLAFDSGGVTQHARDHLVIGACP